MNVILLDASSPRWGSEVERIGIELGAGHNPTLFPYHFLFVTLSKIGGHIAIFRQDGQRIGIGFLFPRGLQRHADDLQHVYTLRYHSLLPPEMPVDPSNAAASCAAALGGDCTLVFYDPHADRSYESTSEQIGPVNLGRPNAAEALALRALQQEVWGSPPEFLYPSDIHSPEFSAGTSIVARVEGTLAGFLFGFYRFDGSPLPAGWGEHYNGQLRLESQTMAVLPAYRGLRIASLLKRVQAQQAWSEGIGVIHWTADPLQFPNAALNFGLLRAVAYEFAADLYPFRNDLNRVHASRVSLTWLVASRRVDDVPLVGSRAEVIDMSHRWQIGRVNDGPHSADLARQDSLIAIEVPLEWTSLQQEDLNKALAWRQVTDEVLQHYVGSDEGKYVITGVGAADERRFLLAERVSPALWQQLGQPA
jgi:predicted GNAT superfamily acetyltransferase